MNVHACMVLLCWQMEHSLVSAGNGDSRNLDWRGSATCLGFGVRGIGLEGWSSSPGNRSTNHNRSTFFYKFMQHQATKW